MVTPVEAARRFLVSLALGLCLGVWYSFLRPLRRKGNSFGDFLFVAVFFWAWLWHGFAVCHGDLRLGTCAGLPLGVLLWELGPGRYLRPIFYRFWGVVGKILHFAAFPLRKIFQFLLNF